VKRRSFLAASVAPVLAPSLARGPSPAAGGPSPSADASSPPAVTIGLERVAVDHGGPLRGRKVGFVGHAASVDASGRHAIDVLRSAGVEVVRLFGPEHGLRGRAAAGEEVAGGVDAESGLPVVSLYGAKTRPAAEDLRGLDTLVFDLQDAGVRFYTYASTMLLCVEAAAGAGVECVVLDRPNPVGGARVDGPERDPAVPSNLFLTPGPLVHGLTLGEMARLWNARLAKPGRVSVVAMNGWKRPMTWTDTGRPWVVPSPNLRSADAALAYPGTCLLEGTNVTEGRGTDAPFLVIGAPWLKAEELARGAEGFGFGLEAVTFTPEPSPAAPLPKHLGARCQGVRVRVVEPASARPWAFGVGLLVLLKRLHPESFEWIRDGATIDTLVGTRAFRPAVDRGLPADAVLARDAAAVDRWLEARRPFLLY
jgi:uncharacterized protein YbbC (DUF1343 family)